MILLDNDGLKVRKAINCLTTALTIYGILMAMEVSV